MLGRHLLAVDLEDRRVQKLKIQSERNSLGRYEGIEGLRPFSCRIVLGEQEEEVMPHTVLDQDCRLRLHFVHWMAGAGYLYDLAREICLQSAATGGNRKRDRPISFRLRCRSECRRTKSPVRLRLNCSIGVGGKGIVFETERLIADIGRIRSVGNLRLLCLTTCSQQQYEGEDRVNSAFHLRFLSGLRSRSFFHRCKVTACLRLQITSASFVQSDVETDSRDLVRPRAHR